MKVLNSTPLYKKIEEQYYENTIIPELEQVIFNKYLHASTKLILYFT